MRTHCRYAVYVHGEFCFLLRLFTCSHQTSVGNPLQHEFLRVECVNCGSFHDVPVYCGDRFCSVCGSVRRTRVRNRLDFLISNVQCPPTYNFKHLTLTIKNQQNLSLMALNIVNSFRKLRQTSSWKSRVRGGAFVIEITGEPSNWHVHLHIVIESKYYKWDKLLALWMKFSSGRGVWINNLPKSRIIGYLTKYISKSSVPIKHRDIINKALKCTRLFQPFGTWFSINRTYVKPKPICKRCSGTSFYIVGEYSDFYDTRFWKEVPP